ncbi:metal ABC transporter solute-binding protein, Zn/Mn family [Lactobacillus xylocopicola]|uniref:Metal ABC transporter substrate-binding protein n=1 Tax=Lactobacillus xylocopicola TaxID=2976676 RepID=A0ABM8BIE0_9LACO|nr:zinc ABC transporter substrate-binding protein [Lactobacillus xylocopicola]BDR61068.1 metal ABC transporter substrate-binding protein [Lactobacillus xylocopicola]
MKKNSKILAFIAMLSLLLLTLTACSQKPQKDSKISIMTTTNVYADIAQNVVGKYGTAKAVIKNPAADPHDFEPTTNDAKELSNADIVVANGLGYDNWMNKLASSVNKKPLLVSEDLMGLKKGANPHIWFNLAMPEKYVNYLVKRLSKKDPQHADAYRANGRKYLAKIAGIQKTASQIDGRDSKPVYVSEPVFDYALEAAHLKVGNQDFEKAIQNETDPSPAVVQEMTNGIKKRRIAFMVLNSQTSSSTVNNFVKQAKKQNLPILKVRETIPNNTTYLDWMTANYQKLAKVVNN